MKKNRSKAQIAVEYMVLYGVIVALVLGGFKYFLDKTRAHGEEFYNSVNDDIND